ncbi:MAG: response regulator [Verrucomicrobia bacterium]|nr:response regulator [Verrucomicrobiota bacterium]
MVAQNIQITRRVAVVDDDPYYLKATERLLLAYGWPARSFKSANEFLDTSKGEEFSCLLVDLQMPGLSGCELIEQLRSKGIETPCLIVTARNLNESQRAIADKFVHAVISKPSDAVELISALENACR